jgi:uncharacterized tellurite resistance protein B-like protein
MFGRWSKKAADDTEGDALAAAVRAELSAADRDTQAIVTAIAGLLGGVAYADRNYAAEEEAHVRAALTRVQGMTENGVEAVLRVLRDHIITITTVQSPRYCRTLVELADEELRHQVLSMLVELAAADGNLSHDEVTLLRNTTTALGLAQADYNALQAPHRDKLGALKSKPGAS